MEYWCSFHSYWDSEVKAWKYRSFVMQKELKAAASSNHQLWPWLPQGSSSQRNSLALKPKDHLSVPIGGCKRPFWGEKRCHSPYRGPEFSFHVGLPAIPPAPWSLRSPVLIYT